MRVLDATLAAIQKHGVEGEGYRTLRMIVDDLVEARAALRSIVFLGDEKRLRIAPPPDIHEAIMIARNALGDA